MATQVSIFEYTAAQHYQRAATFHDPLFIHHFGPGERCLFDYLNFRAWQKNNLIVHTTGKFLANNTGLGLRSVERHLKTLLSARLIRTQLVDYKRGNLYFVEPLLLSEFYWKHSQKREALKHIEKSQFYRVVQKIKAGQFDLVAIAADIEKLRQNGGASSSSDAKRGGPRQNGGGVTPDWRSLIEHVRKEPRQNGGQIYLLYSLLLCGAPRHATPTTSAGANGTLFPPGPPQERCPNGQDQKETDKGVTGLEAGESINPWTTIDSQTHEEIEAFKSKIGITPGKKSVGRGGDCNSRAPSKF